MAAGFYTSSPEARIFVHLDHFHIHHLFPVTPGLNITEVQGCVSIPQKLQPLLVAMADPQYIASWEAELVRLKSKKKPSEDVD